MFLNVIFFLLIFIVVSFDVFEAKDETKFFIQVLISFSLFGYLNRIFKDTKRFRTKSLKASKIEILF